MKLCGVVLLLIGAYSGSTTAAENTTATTQAQTKPTTLGPSGTTLNTTGATTQVDTTMMTATVTGTTNTNTTTANSTTPTGNMTTSAVKSTTAASGNFTENVTVTTEVITTVTPEPIPRFVVNNTNGEPCMLLNFDATVSVKYETTTGEWLESIIPVTNTTSFDGSCTNGSSLREFTLYYPSRDYCVMLILFFNVTSKTTYYNRNGLSVRYIEPCVQPNAKKYNTVHNGHYPDRSYDGTIGKSFKCNSIMNKARYFNVTLNNVLMQPFAQMSADPGHFGTVENCKEPALTTNNPIVTSPSSIPPTKPSPSNGGMIAGIVIGVLVAVALVAGVAFYVIRKRRITKNVAYGNL